MPADTANDNTKDCQSATAADIASVRSEMTKMESDNLTKPETPADMANDKTEGRQKLATAADMAKVKSEMVQMKSVLSKPGTLADMANDNTKERQELATTADMAEVKSEMANIKSEIANVKSEMANIKSGGRMELKAPTDMANIKANNRQQSVTAAEMTDVESEMAKMKANNLTHRQKLETPTSMAKTQSSNDAAQSSKGRRTPEVIVLSSDPTESPASALPSTVNTKSDESKRLHLEEVASMATTQSTNAAIRSGTTLPIPAVIVLSSDPTESPTPPDTEKRTIEVIVLSSDPPESASSTRSPSHNSKRLCANSPDSASKRPRGSPAAEGKVQKKAGPNQLFLRH
ncbi:hypothetical protein KC315_g10270 [Hortaea werneckii]|nr:hypothetical protein KC315_g10270 [Hortaea werneckii]KAI7346458.1 hypothetical protein KC354_g14265 [Hortaea werneckii]